MEHQLAIIIPAYKSRFLKQALESISNQSCKDFTLYIGDDASSDDIYSLIKQYQNKIKICYKRFNENLGKKSLTKQWERCIKLSKKEPFIWLFSDDDEMSVNAVSNFYKEINKANDFSIFRFDLKIINENGETTQECNYPETENNIEFFKKRIQESIYSCMTQCIFKREKYISENGFVEFPFAWFSDDASWIKFSDNNGFKKINGAQVKWRLAKEINITSSKKYEGQKARAVFEYAIWFNNYFSQIIDHKELKKITKEFFAKRMFKMPIHEYYKLDGVKTIFSLTGIAGGSYLYAYDIYCRINRLRSINTLF